MKLFRSNEEKEAATDARAEYERFFAVLLNGGEPAQVRSEAKALQAGGAAAAISPRERRKLGEKAFHAYAEAALADDLLSDEEEEAFYDVCEAVGMDDDWQRDRDLLFRLAIAKANYGRLDTLATSHVMTKKNEAVHLEMVGELMKEVVDRQFRGRSSGISFRIAPGVRYRTGAFRGHNVVVGSHLEVADSGVLAVTSSRIVFLGSRKTVEIPYSKLLGMDVFLDGVRFSASNRQNAPLFRLEHGEVVAATVNAAVQRLNP